MRARLKDDSGQGMLPLMVLVAFSVLVIMFSLLVPWGSATTDKTQTQTAADAAALAAADRTVDLWEAATRPGTLSYLSGPLQARTVRGLACRSTTVSGFAERNSTRLRSCQPSGDGEVRALVRSTTDKGGDNPPAEAEATVDVDIDLGACAWDTPPPPVPPTPFTSTLRCGSWSAEYLLANTPPLYPTLSLTTGTHEQLFSDVEPRLVD